MNKMKNKKILLTGITGQMGAIAARKLVEDNIVIGITRRTSNSGLERLKGVIGHPNLVLVSGDITDYSSIDRVIRDEKPDVIGNLAASSHVGISFESPIENLKITGEGCANVLEAIRNNYSETYRPKFWQMSTSEMFGSNFTLQNEITGEVSHHSYNDPEGKYLLKKCPLWCYQNEETPLSANSPYGAAKIYAHNMVELYRRAYGIYANSIICFNFESEFRGDNFVTRKITKHLSLMKKWVDDIGGFDKIDGFEGDCLYSSEVGSSFLKLRLGNVEACRDWTYAEDTLDAILLSLEKRSSTYCVCSNNTHTVEEFYYSCFDQLFGRADRASECYVVDPKFYRPVEVPFLRGKSSKINSIGWKPKYTLHNIIDKMLENDKIAP